MKKKFSVEQIVGVLKQAEVGVPVAELIRKTGITEQTYYRWKAKYAGLEVDQVRQIKQLREENTRLKQLVAELTLDKTMLQECCEKSCKALPTPPVSRVSEDEQPGECAARVRDSGDRSNNISLRRSQGAMDRASHANARDRPDPSTVRISIDPRAVEPRGLEGW